MARTKKRKTATPKKKKRTMSPAQKAALKKGQAALKRWRAAQKKSGTTSTKKKRSKPKTKSTAVTTTTKKKSGRRTMAGSTVAKKVTRGISSLARKSNAVEMLQDASLVILAGITSGYLTSKIPISDGRVRSMVPIAAGIGLSALTGRRNKIARGVSQGMVILGAVSLFKQLAPGVPMMAGDRIILLPSSTMGRRLNMTNRGRATLGRRVRYAGMAGNSVVGYRTGANT